MKHELVNLPARRLNLDLVQFSMPIQERSEACVNSTMIFEDLNYTSLFIVAVRSRVKFTSNVDTDNSHVEKDHGNNVWKSDLQISTIFCVKSIH